MSRLFGAARAASEYVRQRFNREVRAADRHIRDHGTQAQQARSLIQRMSDYMLGRQSGPQSPSSPQPPFPPPPPQPPSPPIAGGDGPEDDDDRQRREQQRREYEEFQRQVELERQRRQADAEEEFDDIQLLGRDASYHENDWRVVMDRMRMTPGSSNVYGYYFERESRTTGILYVTFLATGGRGSGPTYAYYTVPVRKFQDFQRATASSAGGAVWDYLRIRGTTWGHQHTYRLVSVSGDYVPRKATRRGFAARAITDPGTGRRAYRRNTLRAYNEPPDRGGPNRGRPNNGRPDDGRP
jgi:hypothetical protein